MTPEEKLIKLEKKLERQLLWRKQYYEYKKKLYKEQEDRVLNYCKKIIVINIFCIAIVSSNNIIIIIIKVIVVICAINEFKTR